MDVDLMGKTALLAGDLDETMTAISAALMGAGARVVACEPPVWGNVPYPTVSLAAGDPDQINAQVHGLDRVDIAIINAGWRGYGDFLASTPHDWEHAIQANFEQPLYIAQAVARRMIAHDEGGRIVFIAGVECLMAFSGAAALGATLTMMWAMAKMAAVDLAQYGITVNVIAPGWTNGAAFQSLADDARSHILLGIPSQVAGTAADVVNAALFFASAMSGYITGAILPVDGGYTLTRADGRGMFERG
jgi:NAD(P)-dependent dehydrogenase (short-subunit alcohol dehydrogenase family)